MSDYMKKLVVLFIAITLVLSCSDSRNDNKNKSSNVEKIRKTDNTISSTEIDNYPEIITTLGKEELYNNLKWNLYCISCDKEVYIFKDTSIEAIPNKTYGMVTIVFDRLRYINDSEMHITFNHVYNGSEKGCHYFYNRGYYGAVFNTTNNDSLMYYYSCGRLKMVLCNPITGYCPREVQPLQEDVIKFIKENKDKLSLWFRTEAIKRGVLEDELQHNSTPT